MRGDTILHLFKHTCIAIDVLLDLAFTLKNTQNNCCLKRRPLNGTPSHFFQSEWVCVFVVVVVVVVAAFNHHTCMLDVCCTICIVLPSFNIFTSLCFFISSRDSIKKYTLLSYSPKVLKNKRNVEHTHTHP